MTPPLLELIDASVTHNGAGQPTLRNVTAEVRPGQLVLVTGRTGAGKTTLLGLANGTVPHLTAATLAGDVRVSGRSIRTHAPRDLAADVAFVVQNPLRGFVAHNVQNEIAFSLEQHGIDRDTMRQRIDDVAGLVGITHLLDAQLTQISQGEQQRVAIAAAMAMRAPLLVLDEPLSALDPAAAGQLVDLLRALVHNHDMSILIAEHRLAGLLPLADVVWNVADGSVTSGAPRDMLNWIDNLPPVTQLGQRAGWTPLPLTVREARTHARLHGDASSQAEVLPPMPTSSAGLRATREMFGTVDVSVTHADVLALDGVTVSFAPASATAIMGHNGAGKSTLLSTLAGQTSLWAGKVQVAVDARVRLVPSNAPDLFVTDTVERECTIADIDGGRDAGATAKRLAAFGTTLDGAAHPLDLSAGQQLCLALAVQTASPCDYLLLDEPTRGLDDEARATLISILRRLQSEGTTVILATHDAELAAAVADRVVVLSRGQLIADQPAQTALSASAVRATQVARVFPQTGWLTPADVDVQALRHSEPVMVAP